MGSRADFYDGSNVPAACIEGAQAFRDGKSQSDNPYLEETKEWGNWCDGWVSQHGADEYAAAYGNQD